MSFNQLANSAGTLGPQVTEARRVALYLRSACAQQGNPATALARQRETLLNLVAAQGLRIVVEHSDAGAPGHCLKRPGFGRLMQEAQAKPRPFDNVLVESFSRISRDPIHVMEVATSLAACGIALMAADQAAAWPPSITNLPTSGM